MPRVQEHSQDPQAARDLALRSLAVRPRTVAELSQRLKARFGEVVIRTVVQELQAQGLLDDAAFAEAWRHSRERLRPRSAALVRRELIQRGVAPELADDAVTDMDDADAAERVARKQWGRLSALDRISFRRRMWGHLSRRGFSASVVQSTIRSLERELADSRGEAGLQGPSPTE